MNFETKRLLCKSLSIADYADFEAGQEPEWDGFTNPYKHLVEGPSPLRHRIPRVKKDPEFAEIGLVLAIAEGEVVGSAGFHDYPDENGMIEIGFGIVPEKQRQGYQHQPHSLVPEAGVGTAVAGSRVPRGGSLRIMHGHRDQARHGRFPEGCRCARVELAVGR